MSETSFTSLKNLEDFLYELRNAGSKFSLERIARLLESLGNPQEKYPCIHVAGTNGKGSTCAMFESVLRRAGQKVGMFTSPHLVYLGERVQVNRNPIKKERLIELVGRIRKVADSIFNPEDKANYPSFFEYMTALAFLEFAEQNVDCAIIEVGLGGRLDSTNILKKPILSVITSIGFDHTQFLGNSYADIATEKAGIIKDNSLVVCGWLPEEAENVVKKVSESKKAHFFSMKEKYGDDFSELPKTSLNGLYQRRNAALVKESFLILADYAKRNFISSKFSEINLHTVEEALMNVSWDARWQSIFMKNGARLILDASHNEECSRVLESNLSDFCSENPKPAIAVSVLGADRAEAILGVVQKYASKIYLIKASEPRALSCLQLRSYLSNFKGEIIDSTVGSLFPAPFESVALSGKFQTLVCTGSIYLCGEVLARVKNISHDGLSDVLPLDKKR